MGIVSRAALAAAKRLAKRRADALAKEKAAARRSLAVKGNAALGLAVKVKPSTRKKSDFAVSGVRGKDGAMSGRATKRKAANVNTTPAWDDPKQLLQSLKDEYYYDQPNRRDITLKDFTDEQILTAKEGLGYYEDTYVDPTPEELAQFQADSRAWELQAQARNRENEAWLVNPANADLGWGAKMPHSGEAEILGFPSAAVVRPTNGPPSPVVNVVGPIQPWNDPDKLLQELKEMYAYGPHPEAWTMKDFTDEQIGYGKESLGWDYSDPFSAPESWQQGLAVKVKRPVGKGAPLED